MIELIGNFSLGWFQRLVQRILKRGDILTISLEEDKETEHTNIWIVFLRHEIQ